MIYCDYNATSPILPKVKDAMLEAMRLPLNPSSVHSYGRHAKTLIEDARISIASSLGLNLRKDGYELGFTSSATEANNLLISNFLKGRIIISAVEHPSIMKYKEYYNNVEILSVDSNGIVDLEYLEKLLSDPVSPTLVSVMLANNETGVIQPVRDIARIVHKYGALFHSDLVQGPGKIELDILDMGIDFASISAHKFGGPLGAAALIYKPAYHIKPQIIGGGQERGLRSGTQNVPAIIGFGVAAKSCRSQDSKLRDELDRRIVEICPEAIIFGKDVGRLPNTSMIYMPNVSTNIQLIQFDRHDICVSGGSACSSGVVKLSHVLTAMNIEEDIANCAVRYSFGSESLSDDVEKIVEIWRRLYGEARSSESR